MIMDKSQVSAQKNTLKLSGEINAAVIPELYGIALRLLKTNKVTEIDLTEVSILDSAGVALLDELQSQGAAKSELLLVKGASEEIKAIIDTFSSLALPPEVIVTPPGFFEAIGNALLAFFAEGFEALMLASEVFYWSIIGAFDHRSARKGSLIQQAYALGASALPIVATLSFIIGFILSLQSGVQLRNFGAGIFLADMLSVTLVREMAPMITAIIVAGRSGSSIASEVATMKVTEELDALKMMALNPLRFVIVPKMHAITFVMPILVAFSILVGLLGGGLIAITYLDIPLDAFIKRCINIIIFKDLIVTCVKSIIFAWAIVIIGSHYGFRVQGGAEAVGRATTSAVVTSIFSVIMIDAIFSLLYL